MYRRCTRLIGKGVDVYLIRYHESGVKAQAEVADDLILVGLVLVFCQEIGGAGESDLVDILLHLVSGHTKAVVAESQRLLLRVNNDVYFRFVFVRELVLAHHLQLLQLGDGVAAVGNELTEEDIVIRIEPLLDDRENIFTVNGKTSMFFCHIKHLHFKN